jgi:glycosyltransferase involved in cell wall biosynthesis
MSSYSARSLPSNVELAVSCCNTNPEIMFVIGTLDVGGSERHLASIAPELVARGWRVSVFSLSGDGPLRADLQKKGVIVLQSPISRRQHRGILGRAGRYAIAASALLAAMLLRRPTVAHFFLPEAYITGAPLGLLARIPIRVMSRRSLNNYQSNRRMFRLLERSLHSTMDAVLGNSLAVIRQLSAEGIPDRRLGLIYNGLAENADNASTDRDRLRSALGLSTSSLTLIIVANLIPYKGHADLIEALALADQRMPQDWTLLVVGRDDGIQSQLEELLASRGLASHVRFLGMRRDVPALLAAADIGLLVSHQEGFSNAILEGMAAGLPMIVSDVGGNAEAVRHGETGLVVPARDPNRLGAAIVQLSNDPAARAAFGKSGQNRIQAYFSLAACIDRYDRLYRGLLRGEVPQQIEGIAILDPHSIIPPLPPRLEHQHIP